MQDRQEMRPKTSNAPKPAQKKKVRVFSEIDRLLMGEAEEQEEVEDQQAAQENQTIYTDTPIIMTSEKSEDDMKFGDPLVVE